MELLNAFVSFLAKPTRLPNHSELPFSQQIVEVIQIFVMTFIAVICIAIPLMTLIGADQLPNKLSELENLGFDEKWKQNLALFGLAVIAAPLLEEMIFRFPLRYRRGAIALTMLLIGGLVTNLLQVLGMPMSDALFVSMALIVVIGLYLYFRLREGDALDVFTDRYFPYFFYAAALLFALAHVFNYELTADQWWMTPILVLPQLLLGLMLGYVRLKYGLWASILAHAMNNMIPTMAIIFMPEGGYEGMGE